MLQREKFERLARINGLVPIGRYPTRDGNILVAEGWKDRDEEMKDDAGNYIGHIQTMWAIERTGVDIFQILYCNRFSSQKARVQACMKAAREWVELGKEKGRYA